MVCINDKEYGRKGVSMAGKIQLTPAELLAQSTEMLALEQEFASLFQKTESLLGQVNSDWSANLANNFAGKITSAQKACSSIINMLDGGAKIAETSANTMDSVDQLLKKAINGESTAEGPKSKKFTDWWGTESEDREGIFSGHGSGTAYAYKSEGENGGWYFGKASASGGWGGSLESSGKLWKKKRPDKEFSNDVSYYDIHYQDSVNENYTTFYSPKYTILEGQIIGGQASASILEGSWSNDKTSLYGTVGKVEAHAGINAGLYVYDGNGNKVFTPGVKAEIGASATALHGSWDQQWLGDEMLGLNSHVEVTVGKAEAKGEVNLGFVENNAGHTSFQADVKLSAEAIAAEAKGSVGLNVLGGEVGVKGSVNFGVGAHADFGYKDGVIKCDIGASLGVGASVGFEIDVGGMVDTAIEHAEDIGNAIEKGAEAVGDFAEDVGDAIADGAEAAWDGFKGLFGF